VTLRELALVVLAKIHQLGARQKCCITLALSSRRWLLLLIVVSMELLKVKMWAAKPTWGLCFNEGIPGTIG
jgi:hypothetical protein